jgi:ribosomal-protein-alanine N-acetyltransferase
VSADLAVRPLALGDCATLSARLPALLAGDWSVAALAASPHQQRVLAARSDLPQLRGFAAYYQVLDECHLLDLAIWPEWQQQGLGRYLLEAVLAQAHESGCTQCLLEVRRSNLAARTLYQRVGFNEVGNRRGYYPPREIGGGREDALLYSLELR